MGYTYLLECSDGSYYTGCTNDISKKFIEHQNGQGIHYTAKRLPVKLVYLERFASMDKALQRKKQLQGWSRKKKEALIDKNFHLLPDLSKAYRDIL